MAIIEKAILISLSIYIAWVIATYYFLEGRIHLLLRFDPVGRVLNVTVANNIIVGTILAFWALQYRHTLSSEFISQVLLNLQLEQLQSLGHPQ